MSEESDDKQFDASESKLRKAREQGDIPRSAELQAALGYLGFLFAVLFAASWAVPGWIRVAARALGSEPWSGGDGKAVLPDLGRINPIRNAGQKFGKSGMTNFVISLAKAVLVGAGGWLLYASVLDWLMNASSMTDLQWVDEMGLILRHSIWLALGIGVIFSGIDLVWKRLDYRRRQRMTRREMQDEYKESEGDPHLKAARRQRGVDIVLSSMLADVERADVVIVNPTHYAVALEWKRGSGRAPVCLAKGMDEVAWRIRERANDHRVPIWSDPPCARALHATVEIGAEISAEHFAPVAAAIRFAEAMRKRARDGWGLVPRGKDRS
jgi:flagellar biosynthetic protein FlhB